ncbi:hypothetical protein FQN53_005659 [Emmonsiellopsis sp. PD_33]|nr:hypothetical protein FQN53_005659 [Emmonsiellopsis sp. PD_33]
MDSAVIQLQKAPCPQYNGKLERWRQRSSGRTSAKDLVKDIHQRMVREKARRRSVNAGVSVQQCAIYERFGESDTELEQVDKISCAWDLCRGPGSLFAGEECFLRKDLYSSCLEDVQRTGKALGSARKPQL